MKKLGLIAVILWIPTIAFVGYTFLFGFAKKSNDQRIAVMLNEDERDLVLGEMRTLLSAVHGILNSVQKGDQAGAAQAARSAGMVMAVDVNPAFIAKLPVEFKKLGMSVHADFDQFAQELEAGMNERMVIGRLSGITQKCIACHAAYRFSNSGVPKPVETSYKGFRGLKLDPKVARFLQNQNVQENDPAVLGSI